MAAALAAQRAALQAQKSYTMNDLRRYRGINGGAILVAVDGNVFDVTEGRSFYGPGGEYPSLTGCNATRLLAKGILGPESEEESKKPLSSGEIRDLIQWVHHFNFKYGPALGPLVDSEAPVIESSAGDASDDDPSWRMVAFEGAMPSISER